MGFALVLLAGCSDSATGPAAPGGQLKALKAGVETSCALMRSGALWCWGTKVDDFAHAADSVPQKLSGSLTLTDFSVADDVFGGAICAVDAAHATYCWGNYAKWDSYISYGASPTLLQDTLPITKVSAGDGHVCGLATTGVAYCWGSFVAGKRGNGAPVPSTPDTNWASTTVTAVAGGLSFSALGASRVHTCGLTTTGTVYCWGLGPMLGDTASVDYRTSAECLYPYQPTCTWTPKPVQALSSVTALSVGGFGSCALIQGGAVWCWGPTGDTLAPIGLPTAVPLPESATLISVGTREACALGSSGAAYCWGQIGPWRGTATATAAPAPVETGLHFVSLTVGGMHACGLADDDYVYCWGSNTQGQLGDGTHVTSTAPIRVLLQ